MRILLRLKYYPNTSSESQLQPVYGRTAIHFTVYLRSVRVKGSNFQLFFNGTIYDRRFLSDDNPEIKQIFEIQGGFTDSLMNRCRKKPLSSIF